MTICIPSVEFAHSTSDAELQLLKMFDEQLGVDFTVLHSVAWISKPRGSTPRDGEADFLIVHPRFGVLVIEVKGGGISLDQNRQWISTDRHGKKYKIKNPFDQAKRGKYSILEKLKESPAWTRLKIKRFNIGHAVFFPNIGTGHKFNAPESPHNIIGDRGNMGNLADWIAQVFDYWNGDSNGALDKIGTGGVDVITSIFARVVTTKPLLSARIQDEEKQRIELTRRQMDILDMLRRQKRVIISGGAGTGKTLIAREKAIRLANEGMKTLLVCLNRGLADHLREQCDNVSNLDVATFHQVCDKWTRRAKKEKGQDYLIEAKRNHPRADMFNQLMPNALSNAVDVLGPKYDAIIVDEGQDFGDEYWMPIEMLLNNFDHGLLYVFIDENQDIYKRSASIPIKMEPMTLDRNCRNTGEIHQAAYTHYRGAFVERSKIDGMEVQILGASTIQKQASSIGALITRLITEEKVQPHNIAVLLCDGIDKASYEQAISAVPIPRTAKYQKLENYAEGIITVDTVARFKGLERDVIILWAFDSHSINRKTLYVGMSRAKSILYLCGSTTSCEAILKQSS